MVTLTVPARQPVTAAPESSRTPRWVPVAAGTLYLGLSLMMMARFLAHPETTTSGHTAFTDQAWFEWLLQHGAHSLLHLTNPLHSTLQNAPEGVNMIANTSVLGITVPLGPLTLLFGPRITYILWLVLAPAATAATTAWMVRRHLRVSPAAAVVAGAFFGFAPGVVAHANGQPNFISNFLLPLIVAGVFCGRSGVRLGLLIAWQLLINEELLWITALACGLAVVFSGRFRDAALFRRVGIAGAVTFVLTAYPIWYQFFGPGSFKGVPGFSTWGDDVLGYVTFWRDNLGWGFGPQKAFGTTDLYSCFGIPLMIAIVVLGVLLWRRTPLIRVVVPLMLVFAVLSLGPMIKVGGVATGVPGPMALLTFAPFDMMLPARMNFVVMGGIVVLLALGWDLVVKGRRLPAALILVALLPLIPKPLPAKERPLPPEFIRTEAWRQYVPEGATMVPFPLPYLVVGADSFGWSSWRGADFATPEGYFLGPDELGRGHNGPAARSGTRMMIDQVFTDGKVPTVTDEMRAATRADLARWNASVVVVDANPKFDSVLQLTTDLLGPPQRVLDVWIWPINRAGS